MPKNRLDKVNELIMREVSTLINERVTDREMLITIGGVATTPNMASARVFISVFPKEKEEAAERLLQENLLGMQAILNKRLHMRHVPRIIFVIERGKNAEEVERLLDELGKEQ